MDIQNKKIQSLFVVLLGLLLVGGVFYFLSVKKVVKLPAPVEEEEQIVTEEVKGSVLVSAAFNSDTNAMDVSIAPADENPIVLSAFAVRGFLTTSEGFSTEKALTLTTNSDLTQINWNYQITNAEVDEAGQLLIEVEANHRGDELYPLEGEVVIASIPLSGSYTDALELSLDEDTTVFLGEDVEVEYPYSSGL